jgi:DNA polymerase-1
MARERVFLIDGAALFYRSYFAFIRNPLFNSKGENTSAPFGFCNTLVRLIGEEKPDYLAVVFDTAEPTFRHKLYPDYKATREKMPEEMRQQYPRILEFLDLMNIPRLEKVGFEADDLMGTIALREAKNDREVYLVTGDKDFMQLLQPRIFMYAPGKGGEAAEIGDATAVEKKFGCRPDQVIEVLGLMGDSSDNVPGVPKVGPKSAQKLIAEFGSIYKLYANVESLKASKMKENLIAFREQALLSRELVTIDTDVDFSYNINDFTLDRLTYEDVEPWFREMEFSGIWQRLADLEVISGPQELNSEAAAIATNYRYVNTLAELEQVCTEVSVYPEMTFDTETTSLQINDAELVGLSLSIKPGQGWYINLDASNLDATEAQQRLDMLKTVLEDEEIGLIGQNAKYDIQVLRRYGINPKPLLFDTMLAAYLLDSNDEHNMDHLAQRYLQVKTTSYSELMAGAGKGADIRAVAAEKLANYAAEDADITLRLYRELAPKINAAGLAGLLHEVEVPLAVVLAQVESNGVKLDVEMLGNYSLELEASLERISANLQTMAGREFNLNSPSQLGPILFEEMEVHKSAGLQRLPKTKTGKYSTAENVLQKLAGHPFVDLILDYRKLNKLKSTYVDVLPDLLSSTTGLLHTSFNQTVAATGRLSSSDPNLQNIPIRTEEGRKIRAAFIPRQDGNRIVSADYSQIELRIMAALSEDENMRRAFQAGEDIHQRTAASVFHVDLEAVDSAMRRKAKEVNFGIIYGISQYGLARRLNISNAEAEDFIAAYFAVYPQVQRFMAETVAAASQVGYVETIMKRKRYIPELKSSNRQTFENGQRMAINSRIQGSAADLIKVAMIRIQAELDERKMASKMILQVHDELVFDAPAAEVDQLIPMVKEIMAGAMQLDVPLVVEAGVGANWLEAH